MTPVGTRAPWRGRRLRARRRLMSSCTSSKANGANSVLRVARVRGDDAGWYMCTVARAPPPGPPPAHVILHVIK
ncbi:Uncharacterized protein OBRU01_08971, partial [Operophtera brumata]